jgi:hypothetical protein
MSEQQHDVHKNARGGADQQTDMHAKAEAGDHTKFTSAGAIPPVQMRATGGGAAGVAQQSASDRAFGVEHETHAIADAGVKGAGTQLPHAERIAAAFGKHGAAVLDVRAHTGAEAQQATSALGAQAYANGNAIAFRESPDLRTAAHEAAHVIQQGGGGVKVKGGIGEANDQHEQLADEVADRVVQGQSAQDLLDPVAAKGDQPAAGDKAVQAKAVQFLGSVLGKPLPAGAERPLQETEDQRRYSVDQYEHMWEAEQGKQLTPDNKSTIDRGCIGISANNIAGGGNPLQYAEATFGDFDHAHKFMEGKNTELHQMRADPKQAAHAPQGEYVLFAKQFWSNQKDPAGANKQADDKAFRPDPKTGRVDMTGYQYKAQPGYVNFDYGFWDEASQSFWHANHSQPGMVVYQSTKEHFIRGYIDFDRCIFAVALAKNYDPGKAAMDANANGNAAATKPEQPAPTHQ